jgi:hypothetical protein
MKSFLTFIVCAILALASFAYARHHYVKTNSVTLTNPLNTSQSRSVTNPLVDQSLFGEWIKDEWVFAIAVPALLIVGGLVLSTRK